MLTKPYHLLSFQTILPAGPPQVSVPYHHHSSLATMMLATGVFTPVLWLNWSERAAHYVKSCIIYPRHCSFFHDVSETFSSWYLCLKHNGSQSIHLPRRLLSLSLCVRGVLAQTVNLPIRQPSIAEACECILVW